MAANTTDQYRPISSLETATDDALTSRFPRDMADNLNNYCRYVAAHKVIAQICAPEWVSHGSTTYEHVVWIGAPRQIPDGFTHLFAVAHHYRREGADDVTWRLYCSQYPYTGPGDDMDVSRFVGTYASISFASDAATLTRSVTPFAAMLAIHRGLGGLSYFTLTAENGDGSTRAALVSLDAWPGFGVTQMELL